MWLFFFAFKSELSFDCSCCFTLVVNRLAVLLSMGGTSTYSCVCHWVWIASTHRWNRNMFKYLNLSSSQPLNNEQTAKTRPTNEQEHADRAFHINHSYSGNVVNKSIQKFLQRYIVYRWKFNVVRMSPECKQQIWSDKKLYPSISYL